MWQKFTALLILPLMLVIVLTLSGCAGLTPTEKESASGHDIVRAVKIISPNATLLTRAQNTLDTLSTVDVVAEDSFADLSLIVKSGKRATSKGLFETQAPIVGILKHQQQPTILHLSYSLLTQEGDELRKGDVVGMGEDKTSYFPSLRLNQDDKKSTKALNDGLNQLKKELSAEIRNAPFTGKVTTQMTTNNQVGVPVYQNAGLKPTHKFHVRGAPETKLRFVGTTQGLDGSQTHALLEMIEGQMPALNSVVVLD